MPGADFCHPRHTAHKSLCLYRSEERRWQIVRNLKLHQIPASTPRARPLLPSETGPRENQQRQPTVRIPFRLLICGAGTRLIEAKHFVECNGRPVTSVKTAFKSAVGLVGLGNINAATSLTLVLPVDRYDYCFLVASVGEEPTAVILDERHQYQAFNCRGNTSHKGLLIPDVRIEVDASLVYDAVGRWAVPGTIVRRDDGLFISTADERGVGRGPLIALQRGLASSEQNMAAGFPRWQIVIGDGIEKRVLKVIDLEQSSEWQA